MVYIILGQGFEETEAIVPGDILRRGEVELKYASVGSLDVTGAHNITVTADMAVKDIQLAKGDMIVLPGGLGGVESIEASAEAMDLIKQAHDKGLQIAAICAAPRILAGLGLIRGKRVTHYPGMEDQMGDCTTNVDESTVTDGKIITGRAPGAAIDFALALLTELKGKAVAEAVRSDFVYDK